MHSLLWARIIFYVLGHAALAYIVWHGMWFSLFLSVVVFLLGGFAVSSYAHRTLAHGTIEWKSSKLEWFQIFMCVASGIGSPLGWAAVHRMHHAYLDTEKDPHSPWQIGFFRSYFHLWWVDPTKVSPKFLAGLTKHKKLLWIHQNSIICLIAVHAILFGLFGLIGLAASALGVHAMGFTNAVNHYVSEPKEIRSTPTWWMQVGENCHEHHHNSPRDYSFGDGISDPTARVLELLEKFNLVKIRRYI